MKSFKKRQLSEISSGILFIFPAVILILLFIAYPIVQSLLLSFFKWPGYGEWEFIGIRNYIEMFTQDKIFYKALRNSMIFATTTAIGTVIGGFILALIINIKIKGWKAYRVLFILPIVIMQVAMSLIWLRMLSPTGLLNNFLELINLGSFTRAWLGDTGIVFIVIIILTIWQYCGSPMIFLLAGLQNIDKEIYEAAEIDGASLFRRTFSITIPLCKNVIVVVFMLQAIFGLKAFDSIWIMTRGGPVHASEVLGTHLYSSAFVLKQFGYASVVSVVMVVISIVFSIFYTKYSGYGKEGISL